MHSPPPTLQKRERHLSALLFQSMDSNSINTTLKIHPQLYFGHIYWQAFTLTSLTNMFSLETSVLQRYVYWEWQIHVGSLEGDVRSPVSNFQVVGVDLSSRTVAIIKTGCFSLLYMQRIAFAVWFSVKVRCHIVKIISVQCHKVTPLIMISIQRLLPYNSVATEEDKFVLHNLFSASFSFQDKREGVDGMLYTTVFY